MAEDEGFLSRWSRRKIAEKHRDEETVPELVEQASDEAVAVPGEEVDPDTAEASEAEPERHPAEDIDIESLTRESDFTVFMEKGVSAATRRMALRKLWTSDPVLANLDGLNDYEDMEWTYGLSEAATTDWKLGRGFLNDKELGLEVSEETPEDGDHEAAELAEEGDEPVTEDDPDAVAEAEADGGSSQDGEDAADRPA